MQSSKFDPEFPIRVSVVPSQSSYFAGEQFSVDITFTNLRSSNDAVKRTLSASHKRGSHSISSAPMARPPTSPVTPRTAVPVLQPSTSGGAGRKRERRGIIGSHAAAGSVPQNAAQDLFLRRPVATRSHSVTISPLDVHSTLASSSQNGIEGNLPQRSSTLPLSSHHPHARKQSMLDGQVQLQDMTTSPSPSPSVFSATASTSTFSLALDTISESMPSAFPGTPATSSPFHSYPPKLDSHQSTVPSYPPRPPGSGTATQGRTVSLNSPVGLGPPPIANHAPPRTAFSSTFSQPNTELVLYAYAQLVGTVVIVAPPGTPQTPSQEEALAGLRGALSKRKTMGGGSMDITSSLHSRPSARRSHSRASSLSSSLFSLLSPSPSMPASQPWSPGHKSRSPSLVPSFLSTSQSSPNPSGYGNRSGSGTVGLGIGGIGAEYVDPDTPLPTFEVQQTMLAIDLSLGPGESRTYTYLISLPQNLPPTFKGRALKFSYQFSVGVCRASSSHPQAGSSTSRVMKIPIRIYNHTSVNGVQQPYDLLSPLVRSKHQAQYTGQVKEGLFFTSTGSGSGTTSSQPSIGKQVAKIEGSQKPWGSKEELRTYALRLLGSFPDPLSTGVRIKLPVETISPRDQEKEMGELTGCREAVEILTRNPRKMSYDVNKDGVNVAVLTFVKSAYRLGETVLGVLELNGRPNRARVLKFSAMLEAHETLPSAFASPSPTRHLRKVHAEHHSSLITSCLRTTFALDIPSDASPAFNCDLNTGSNSGSSASSGGLEWKVRICLLVAIASEDAREGFDGIKIKHLVRDGPPGEWASSWKATNSIAPMQKPDPVKVKLRMKQAASAASSGASQTQSPVSPATPRGWASYLISSLLSGEREYHDGDEEEYDEDEEGDETITQENGRDLTDELGEVDIGGGDEDWMELKVETVECEVPLKVWPGNTAFRPQEVVFDI